MRHGLVLIVATSLGGCLSDEPADPGDGDQADEVAACDELPRGPFQPRPVLRGLIGTEDMSFDGRGNVAVRVGGALHLVTAKAKSKLVASSLPGSFGMRFRTNGRLAMALPNQGQIVDITPTGQRSVVVEGLELPNGVFPDLADNLWVTEMQGNRVIKVTPAGEVEVIASGADAAAPNGVVFDEKRKALFYTQFGTGIVMRVDMEMEEEPVDETTPGPVEVAQLPNARPDGLALDSCGNIYAVDNGGAQLFRVFLDEVGDAVEEPELLAEFPTSVANPLFGRGTGFATTSLFVVGVAGDLFEIPLSVDGAPVAAPKK